MNPKNKVIIFTDLDGTFLDHETYSFEPAKPALDRLKKMKIPVIAVTSKTYSELQILDLPLNHETCICENGMVVVQEGEINTSHKTYKQIVEFLDGLEKDMRRNIFGFNDMSVEDVMDYTGLNQTDARAARSRDASEPFLWKGSEEDLNKLEKMAKQKGFNLTQGGRFYHLMGQGNKSEAIKRVIENQSEAYPATIALGDGPNDAEMLAVVDYGIIIPNQNGASVKVHNPEGEIIHAKYPGPEGWNQAISDLLDVIEENL